MRTATLLTAAVLGTTLCVTSLASAQDKYPSKAIVMVTHSSPGAGGDIFLRNLGKQATVRAGAHTKSSVARMARRLRQ